MMFKMFNRRRTYVIDKLQHGFILLCLSYVFFFLVVLGVSLFVPLMFGLRADADFSAELVQKADSLLYLHNTFWQAVVLSLIAIALHAIRTSHRVVGPLYRHRVAFQAMAQGRVPPPIHLRQGDYLVQATAELNTMTENLRLRISEIQQDHHHHLEQLDKLRALGERAPREEMMEGLDALSEATHRLALKLDHFRFDR